MIEITCIILCSVACFTCGVVCGSFLRRKPDEKKDAPTMTEADKDTQEQWRRMLNYTGRESE